MNTSFKKYNRARLILLTVCNKYMQRIQIPISSENGMTSLLLSVNKIKLNGYRNDHLKKRASG